MIYLRLRELKYFLKYGVLDLYRRNIVWILNICFYEIIEYNKLVFFL